MQRQSFSSLALAFIVAAGAAHAACGGGGSGGSGQGASSGTGTGTGGNNSTSSGTGAGGEDCFPNCGKDGGAGQLTLVPPSAVIDVVNGQAMPVDFDAEIDGQKVTPESWVVDLSSVATVDGLGIVTPTGTIGGDVVLKAVYNGETATATVKVNIQLLQNPGSTTGTEQDILRNAATPDASIVWAYPYNGTVFPKGLLPPELMWNNGAGGDKYYIHYTTNHVNVEIFTTADPPSRYALADATWKVITESGNGGAVNLHVSRLSNGNATVLVDHAWTIANGSLRGTVYYWANSLGRVLRIKPGAAGPEDFLAQGGQSGCSTCHAVSANGSTLVIGGDIAVSTWDLLTNAPVMNLGNVGKAVRNWAMPAVSPNGQVLVENNAPLPGPPGGADGMWNAQTGMKLLGTGLDGILLDMPAFAPNGTKLAYVDHATHGLGVYDYDAVNVKAMNAVSLVAPGGDPNLNAIAFPSVSPDAKWIVYHRGNYPNSLDTRFGPGDLYLASIDQPGAEARLAQLNGDSYPFAAGARDKSYNYEPTFAPLNSGGFAWVVFTSRRTYGNRLTGGKDSVKQLWVAAIDQNAQPGVDPSHPAFWVPGQDLGTLNMRGFWALDPCKQVGDGCSTGSECCNQNCDMGVCKDPDPNECSQNGNHCDTDADCCDPGAKCINNICSEPPPQ